MISNSPVTGIEWTKSSYSSSTGGECLEYNRACAGSGLVPVRDSKVPHGPTFSVGTAAWRSFVGAVRTGELAD